MKYAFAYRHFDAVIAHEDEAAGRAEFSSRTGEEVSVSSCRLDPKGGDILVDALGRSHRASIVFCYAEAIQCA